jgi:hypothetical protein
MQSWLTWTMGAVVATMMWTCDGGSGPAPTEPTPCAAHGDCVLALRACCGPCSPVTDREAITAIHTSDWVAHQSQACGGTPVPCDACLTPIQGWEPFCNAASQCDVRAAAE